MNVKELIHLARMNEQRGDFESADKLMKQAINGWMDISKMLIPVTMLLSKDGEMKGWSDAAISWENPERFYRLEENDDAIVLKCTVPREKANEWRKHGFKNNPLEDLATHAIKIGQIWPSILSKCA
jgi:hypothetical protein